VQIRPSQDPRRYDYQGVVVTGGHDIDPVLYAAEPEIEPDTVLARLIGAPRVRINSLHNQAIDRVGKDLRVSGRDLDDIVQAVEDPAYGFLLGVQWHPEFLLFLRPQRALFRALVEAARAGPRAGRR
jgi:putative glutamine amidotransferase